MNGTFHACEGKFTLNKQEMIAIPSSNAPFPQMPNSNLPELVHFSPHAESLEEKAVLIDKLKIDTI
jgi:hypothetical protein